VHEAVASLGIAVRRFPGQAHLERALRITCPGRADAFERLTHALSAALAPQALLFDVDGVLADVSGSYRRAIVETAASFGALVTAADVAEIKARGDANNDWVVTQRLLAEHGVTASLAEVTVRFEEIYQGTRSRPGLWESETLLPERGLLERLARRIPLGIVTGRPRRDLARFLEREGIAGLFRATVCLEDGPTKPRADPVASALARLSVRHAWMIGDTPDDVAAARAAGVVALCVLGTSERAADPEASTRSLLACGAARVLDSLAELEALLP
jgi:HAD superfamily hydrolase (TIGR01548 family)